MPIEVTARHMSASDMLQDYARKRAGEIVDEFPRVEHLHVILNIEKRRQIAEFVVQASNHIRTEASEDTENMRSSIDGAADKIIRQLRKLRDKVQDHKVVMKHVEAARGVEVEEETEDE